MTDTTDTTTSYGSADAGPRTPLPIARQLAKGDLAGMTAEQIVQAKAAGQLDDLLGIKPDR